MTINVPTPHNSAQTGDFAKTVIMPGDPKRARFIAETFLQNSRLVNDVRGISGYTGLYKGLPVSVMASGMGMPSMGIYSYELFRFYGVQNIIRVGSAGALSQNLKVRDVVAGMSSFTTSSFSDQYGLPGTLSPTASFELLKAADVASKNSEKDLKVGSLLCSDTFYTDVQNPLDWAKMGVLAIEMESAALYLTAQRLGRRALCIVTISDLMFPPYSPTTADERERSFTDMIGIALETAVLAHSLPDGQKFSE